MHFRHTLQELLF